MSTFEPRNATVPEDAAHEPLLPIRPGDTGAAVRDVQTRLSRGLDGQLAADGVYGQATTTAVRRFQRERGLAADGIVGAETWRDLVEAGYSLGDRLLWRASQPMRGDDIDELQRRLNQLGFNAGAEDGIFGPLTASSVEEFQRNVGLAADGVAGPRTVSALRRLHRAHHDDAAGVAVRVRERESLRHLLSRGLVGARIVVDPAHGPESPGHAGPDWELEHEVTWEFASRLVARLSARGAQALLTRGPSSTPSNHERAVFANEQGADLTLSLAVGAHHTPLASGACAYYFGSSRSTSDVGMRLADELLDATVGLGWLPSGRTHPRTWTLLRETRGPAVVLEPGFITNPDEAARLTDPSKQDALAAALTDGLAAFLDGSHAPRAKAS